MQKINMKIWLLLCVEDGMMKGPWSMSSVSGLGDGELLAGRQYLADEDHAAGSPPADKAYRP